MYLCETTVNVLEYSVVSAFLYLYQEMETLFSPDAGTQSVTGS